MLGYETVGELMATVTDTAEFWVVPADRSRCLAQLESEHGVVGLAYQLRRKDGGTIWASLSGKAGYGGNGDRLYYDWFVQDNTERKHVEEALRKSQEDYQSILQAATAAFA